LRPAGWVLAGLLFCFSETAYAQPAEFERYRNTLWGYLETLTDFGPRYAGTLGYDRTLQLLRQAGREFADEVVEHPFVIRRENGEQVRMVNIEFVFHGSMGGPPVLVGAHYDTRPFADQEPDPETRTRPIQGANDGGSGTAVLLGLARYLKEHPTRLPVRLMFFDGEDFGTTGSGEMFIGSNYHANQLKLLDPKTWPQAVLIADMVGDRDLQIYRESYSVKSGPKLLDRIYSVAQRQNISQFKEEKKYSVLDDHVPFSMLGIPSVVLIDFDYPHWHKLSDTIDKCSPKSLLAVFSVLAGVLREW
jgi:hypothetical protein